MRISKLDALWIQRGWRSLLQQRSVLINLLLNQQNMDKKVYEFISKQKWDPIIEWRKCKFSGEEFPIYQWEKDLLDQMAPTINWEKMNFDLPQYCYRVRMLKRQIFRNEKKFYALPEISIVHDSVRKVLPVKDRHEEDFYKYWIEYSGNFNNDLKELYEKVPYLPRYVVASENSDYCNQTSNEKNCYLCIGWLESENCLYTTYDVQSKYIIDSYGTFNCEISYQSIHIWWSMKSFFCTYLVNCYNTRFGYDLHNCKNVIFGFGLRDQEYIFKNKKYPQEERERIAQEYYKKIKTISWLKELLAEYQEFIDTYPHEDVHNVNSEHPRGTQINNSKNMTFWFWAEGNHDSRYCGIQWRSQNVMDLESSAMSQQTYNCIGSIQMFGCSCISSNFWEMKNAHYGFYMRWSSDILGCFGLQNQSHCILNKKYSKEDREKLATTIIQELRAKQKRGDFMDTEMSPFPYNDSLANRVFPIKQLKIWDKLTTINPDGFGTVEVLNPEKFISDARLDLWWEEKRKIKWRTQEAEINLPTNVPILQVSDLPDDIDTAQKDICDKVIICEKTWRPYKILQMELDFYKQYGLPLPTTHYEYRDNKRCEQLPPRFLELWSCDKCGKENIREFRKNPKFKIYCEQCYNKEIYW